MKIISFLVIIGFLFSCGQSAKERAVAQKVRDDSIRVATRLQIEEIRSLKDLLMQAEAEKDGLNNRLMVFKANLEAAKDKLNTIKQYQFLRTATEREEQVRTQTIAIEQFEKEVENILNEISKREESIKSIKNDLKKYEGDK